MKTTHPIYLDVSVYDNYNNGRLEQCVSLDDEDEDEDEDPEFVTYPTVNILNS